MTTRRPMTRPDARSAKHLVLIGLMGAGKTTVGLECAAPARSRRSSTPTTSSRRARRTHGRRRSSPSDGEDAVPRPRTRRPSPTCARRPTPLVIACGGGTVLDPENRRALRAAGVVVWLRAPAATLAGARRRRHRPARCCATTPPARSPASSASASRPTKRPRTRRSTPTASTSPRSPTRCCRCSTGAAS